MTHNRHVYTIRTAPPQSPGEGRRIWVEHGEKNLPGATLCHDRADAMRVLNRYGVPDDDARRMLQAVS